MMRLKSSWMQSVRASPLKFTYASSNALFRCFAGIVVGQKLIVSEMPLKVNHTAMKLKMRGGQTKHNCMEPAVE